MHQQIPSFEQLKEEVAYLRRLNEQLTGQLAVHSAQQEAMEQLQHTLRKNAIFKRHSG